MEKKTNRTSPMELYRQKLRSLVGTALHAQNIADQALSLARRAMTATDMADSDAVRG